MYVQWYKWDLVKLAFEMSQRYCMVFSNILLKVAVPLFNR